MQSDGQATQSSVNASIIGAEPIITSRVSNEDELEAARRRQATETTPAATFPATLRPIGRAQETSISSDAANLPPPSLEQRVRWRIASSGLDRISIHPAFSSGVPTIRDTRITVAQVLDVLADVETIAAVVKEFSDLLDAADVREALSFAARLAR